MLNTIEEAIEAIKNGEIIIVVDDEDRENEGDFICAADKVTPEIVNFMFFQPAADFSWSSVVRGNGEVPVTEFIVQSREVGNGGSG